MSGWSRGDEQGKCGADGLRSHLRKGGPGPSPGFLICTMRVGAVLPAGDCEEDLRHPGKHLAESLAQPVPGELSDWRMGPLWFQRLPPPGDVDLASFLRFRGEGLEESSTAEQSQGWGSGELLVVGSPGGQSLVPGACLPTGAPASGFAPEIPKGKEVSVPGHELAGGCKRGRPVRSP